MADNDAGWVFPDLTLAFATEFFKSIQWVGTPPLSIATIEDVANMGTGYRFHAVWWWNFHNPKYPYGSAGFVEFEFIETQPIADGYRVSIATEAYPRKHETVLPLGTIVLVRKDESEA